MAINRAGRRQGMFAPPGRERWPRGCSIFKGGLHAAVGFGVGALGVGALGVGALGSVAGRAGELDEALPVEQKARYFFLSSFYLLEGGG